MIGSMVDLYTCVCLYMEQAEAQAWVRALQVLQLMQQRVGDSMGLLQEDLQGSQVVHTLVKMFLQMLWERLSEVHNVHLKGSLEDHWEALIE